MSLKSQDNSLSTSLLTPVANQTGVPDISFQMVNLPATKGFDVSLDLVYNPNSFRMGEYSGQVARNWMFSGSNFMISRDNIDGNIDEVSYNAAWNDIYYYTINGESGSFKFEKRGTVSTNYHHSNDTYHLIKLTPSNLKIEFEREPVASVRLVKSFTITDSKGFKYYFQDYGYSKVPNNQGAQIRNTFYITKILDPKNRQIVTYTNKKYIQYQANSNNTIIDAVSVLPEKIQTDYGSIEIQHGDSGYTFDFHDKYYINGITLKDHKNNFVSKYSLNTEATIYKFYDLHSEYDEFPSTKTMYYRNISHISQLDKYSNILEKTKFVYNTNTSHVYGPSPYWWKDFLGNLGTFRDDDPNSLLFGILKSIILPTGAKIDYDFGVNKVKSHSRHSGDIDKNSAAYIQKMQDPFDFTDPEIQYLELVKTIEFDTETDNNNRKYYLTGLQKSPNTRIYIRFDVDEVYDWDTGLDPELGLLSPPPTLGYKVRNTINSNTTNLYWYNYEIKKEFTTYFYVVPSNGSAYIELIGSGGRGTIDIYEKHFTNPPYINETTLPNSGVRIDKITYHSRGENYHPLYPTYAPNPKVITYDYSLFDEPSVSSGVAVADDQKEAIIYKNIKVTESDKGGYTKYTYKTPFDFPTAMHPTIPNQVVFPHYNLLKKGIISKQEVYDQNNKIINTTNFDYTLPAHDASQLYRYIIRCENCALNTDAYGFMTIYTQEQSIQKMTTQTIEYDSQLNSMTTTVERSFNLANNNLISEKKTTSDGIVSEVNYQYALEKNNTKLLTANMFSIPLEVTQKQNNVQIGKVEMKFDHASNYFPSSIIRLGINSSVISQENNDLYDTKGNVLQTTSKTGIPTTFIYGYNSTLLIAKIEGATYAQVMAALGLPPTPEANQSMEIYFASNLDIDDDSENTLRNKLDEFRLNPSFKDYQITTYTYDPLIGIKSITTPSGNKVYYYYDNANRMIRVEDINHHVIKENKYKDYVLE